MRDSTQVSLVWVGLAVWVYFLVGESALSPLILSLVLAWSLRRAPAADRYWLAFGILMSGLIGTGIGVFGAPEKHVLVATYGNLAIVFALASRIASGPERP